MVSHDCLSVGLPAAGRKSGSGDFFLHACAIMYKRVLPEKREIILRSYKETYFVNGVLQLKFEKTEFSLGV